MEERTPVRCPMFRERGVTLQLPQVRIKQGLVVNNVGARGWLVVVDPPDATVRL